MFASTEIHRLRLKSDRTVFFLIFRIPIDFFVIPFFVVILEKKIVLVSWWWIRNCLFYARECSRAHCDFFWNSLSVVYFENANEIVFQNINKRKITKKEKKYKKTTKKSENSSGNKYIFHFVFVTQTDCVYAFHYFMLFLLHAKLSFESLCAV